jgi:hypothetical protein
MRRGDLPANDEPDCCSECIVKHAKKETDSGPSHRAVAEAESTQPQLWLILRFVSVQRKIKGK